LKLYFVPKTRSTRPRWMLEELGLSYDLVRMDPKKGDTQHPEYLKLNPLGHVPTLVFDPGEGEPGDGPVLYESAAICLQLADQHPEKKLAPALGSPERGLYYQWLFYAMTELEPAIITVLMNTLYLPEKRRDAEEAEEAKTRLLKAAKVLDAHLFTRSFLLGEAFSAADVVMCSVLNWARWLGHFEEGFPNVEQYIDRCMARPAAKRALGG